MEEFTQLESRLLQERNQAVKNSTYWKNQYEQERILTKNLKAELAAERERADRLARAGYNLETALMKFAERWGEDTEQARQEWIDALAAHRQARP